MCVRLFAYPIKKKFLRKFHKVYKAFINIYFQRELLWEVSRQRNNMKSSQNP